MAESELTFSSGVALQAARYFYTRRYLTKFGLLQIASTFVMTGFVLILYHYLGAHWSLGFFVALLMLNTIMQLTMVAAAPGAIAKRVDSYKSKAGHISTREDGFTIVVDGNTLNIPWSKIRYLWPQREFIVLGLSFFAMIPLPAEGMSPDARAEFESRASRKVGA